MKKRILLGVLAALLIVGVSATYVAVSVRSRLAHARAVLARDPADVTEADLSAATDDVEAIGRTLDSVPARILTLVPIARQNLHAVETLTDQAVPVLEDAGRLRALATTVETEGLVEDESARLGLVEDLGAAVTSQLASLTRLEEVVERDANGWMLPPVWEEYHSLGERLSTLTTSLGRARRALDIAPDMLGASDKRTYLVLLMNNAELRGAGGILSSVGTLTVDDGDVSLGDFAYYSDLSDREQPHKVTLPDDFERRFARYVDGPGRWINSTSSPDVPEVAEYVAGLYSGVSPVDVDGAIVVDTHGLAATLPPDAEVRAPGLSNPLRVGDLPQYVHSDVYEIFQVGDERRAALLAMGPAILQGALDQDLSQSDMDRIGAAIRAGHLRIVSFHPDEARTLQDLDVDGGLEDEAEDQLLITVQNLGSDKLDYWMRRDVDHECVIDESRADCRTTVKLRNTAPPGLPLYVVQEKQPYAVYKGYLEIYVPDSAEITTYSLDGEEAEIFVEEEDGRKSLGTYFTTKRTAVTTAVVNYELPIDGGYSLSITPQPLADDARVEVGLDAPEEWTLGGPEGEGQDTLTFRGVLDDVLRFRAAPAEEDGKSGIPRFWEWLSG